MEAGVCLWPPPHVQPGPYKGMYTHLYPTFYLPFFMCQTPLRYCDIYDGLILLGASMDMAIADGETEALKK